MGVDVQVQLFNVREYRARVLPARDAYTRHGHLEPLVEALRWALDRAPDPENGRGEPILLARHRIERLIAGLESSSANDTARLVRGEVLPLLVEACMEWRLDLNPDQNMSRTPLMTHLYAHSRWIMDVFTYAQGVTGGVLEISPGESSQLFSRAEAERLQQELLRVPAPDVPAVRDQLENLRRLVGAAVIEGAGLALLLTIT